MKLEEVLLLTHDLSAQRDFYCGVLGLEELGATDNVLVIAAGNSRLVFRQAPDGWRGYSHFAFNIPENALAAAKRWVEGRVPLITDKAGANQFHSDNWNADQSYFLDPAGNILEFIARHSLENASDMPFAPASILSISEIGLTSEDVPATVDFLRRELGIDVYAGSYSDTFAAVGDADGLLIVVKQGRIWFPDTGLPAVAAAISLQLALTDRGYQLDGPPYEITAI